MRTKPHTLIVALGIVLLGTSFAQADSTDFLTVVGRVEKYQKDTLTVSMGDKSTKTVELKVTGTSKFHLLAPQVRSEKNRPYSTICGSERTYDRPGHRRDLCPG